VKGTALIRQNTYSNVIAAGEPKALSIKSRLPPDLTETNPLLLEMYLNFYVLNYAVIKYLKDIIA
jgi:hypothetical protein